MMTDIAVGKVLRIEPPYAQNNVRSPDLPRERFRLGSHNSNPMLVKRIINRRPHPPFTEG